MNSTGTIVASYTYSPFGERLTNSAPTIYMPLGYGGTYSDPEIELLYAKSRYYRPDIGISLSVSGFDPNLCKLLQK